MKLIDEKSFNNNLKVISNNAEAVANAVHEAGLFAIAQVNEHGNANFGVRLIGALGKKHNAKSVATWLQTFGKFGAKKGELVYKARKDINASNLDAWLEKADQTPYWELTKDEITIVRINYLSALNGLLSRRSNAEESGKTVEETHPELLADIAKLVEKYNKPKAVKAEEAAPVEEAETATVAVEV